MKILINAISIENGGGLTVLVQLLKALLSNAPHITWYVACDERILLSLPIHSKVICLPYQWVKKSYFHHLFWYEVELPKLIKKYKIDICFSQTNFLSQRKLKCPTILLIHQAGYFSQKFKKLNRQWAENFYSGIMWEYRCQWSKRSIRKADFVTVQTLVLAKDIAHQIRVPIEKFKVIPHGTGLLSHTSTGPKQFPKHVNWRIGYITKIGCQKDFFTALEAIKILKEKNFPIKFILTLERSARDRLSLEINKKILAWDIADCVENVGDLKDETDIKNLYHSLDLFVFPSLCESFGFTLVEALSAALPIIAADTPSNIEICEEAAIFFPQENAEWLAKQIKFLMMNENLYQQASCKSLLQAKKYNWDKSAKQILALFHQII